MAYVVCLLSEKEEQILKARGWDLEPSPHELVPSDLPDSACRFRMVWVDASMFEIMNGPDWDQGNGPCSR